MKLALRFLDNEPMDRWTDRRCSFTDELISFESPAFRGATHELDTINNKSMPIVYRTIDTHFLPVMSYCALFKFTNNY